jgi:hypothetical protein
MKLVPRVSLHSSGGAERLRWDAERLFVFARLE